LNRRIAVAVAVGALALTGACGSATSKTVNAAPLSAGTGLSSGTPSPSGTATASTKLQNAASALGEQGRGAFADIYGNLSVDGDHDRVVLYATDTNRAKDLIDAAHKAHPDTVGVEIGITACSYTAQAEQEAVQRIFAAQKTKPFPYEVYSAGITPDGSGVLVATSDEGAKSKDFAQRVQEAAGPVPVKVTSGPEPSPANAIAPSPGTSG